MNHTFVFSAETTLRSVCVAGTFNNWDKNANPLSVDPDGRTWRLALSLEQGRHFYKFVINDNEWLSDPRAARDDSDNYGNSILLLQEPAYPTPENSMDGPLTTQNTAGPPWAQGKPIYEVNLDVYQFPAGTALREFQKHLPVLKDLGVGILWFMPLHPRGQERAKNTPSPYAVQDYRAIDPNYGSNDDFKALITAAHDLKMPILMDWVANHSSWDNHLVKECPDFYRKSENGEIAQADQYSDVAQFDFGRPDAWNQPLWDQMRDDMMYWLREFDIDGFRCDVAGEKGSVPLEFWQWLRPQLESVRPIFMLAEADEARLHPAFDMTYSWNLPPILWDICSGRQPAHAIDEVLRQEADNFPNGAVRMRLLDNHDWHYRDDWGMENGGPDKQNDEMPQIAPLMVLCATLPGKPLLYNGQEMKHNKGEPPADAKARCNSPLWGFYQRLFELHRCQNPITQGNFAKIASSNDEKIYAFVRERENERVLVVLNLSGQNQSITLQSSSVVGEYLNWFSNEKVTFHGQVNLELFPWDYQIFVGQT